MNVEEVAEKLGLSTSEVKRIEFVAMRKIRNAVIKLGENDLNIRQFLTDIMIETKNDGY